MATITEILATDEISDSRAVINTNFDNLNDDKLEESGGTMTGQLNFSGTTHAGIKLLSLTTVQRDALTPVNGMVIYNSTDNRFQAYENGSWKNLIPTAGATIYRTYKMGSEAESSDHRTFTLDTGTFTADESVEVYKSGALMANGSSADYTTSGNDTIVFNYDVDDSDLIVLKVIE